MQIYASPSNPVLSFTLLIKAELIQIFQDVSFSLVEHKFIFTLTIHRHLPKCWAGWARSSMADLICKFMHHQVIQF